MNADVQNPEDISISQDRSLLPVRWEFLPGKGGNDPKLCTQSPR